MPRILPGIDSLEQHLARLNTDPEGYRPACCPHCGQAGVWLHGHYRRKVDREGKDGQYLEPVPIPRFYCPHCQATCSRLPACIAPRRWYLWGAQQAVLVLLLMGWSIRRVAGQQRPARRTVSRWWLRLRERFPVHAFHLCSRFPALGRQPSMASFWQRCLDGMGLAEAMAWLERDGVIVP